MGALDLLEDRITDLEKRVYGLKKTNVIDNTFPEISVIDSLLHANTLISSALSGRENANTMIERLSELNVDIVSLVDLLKLSTEGVCQFLLTVMSDLKKSCDMLSCLQELSSLLETDELRDIPIVSDKLNDISSAYLKFYMVIRDQTSQINTFFFNFNEIISSISKLLIVLNGQLLRAEIASAPKKQID
ncbi:uncharacterized protein LOC143341624 [Colletes latitarsis]|uniref:uncharacterized protein LOC143341624 n=1 Tax=Colletes latitarsis TaxID=2605962 RepID=UPI0040355AA3